MISQNTRTHVAYGIVCGWTLVMILSLPLMIGSGLSFVSFLSGTCSSSCTRWSESLLPTFADHCNSNPHDSRYICFRTTSLRYPELYFPLYVVVFTVPLAILMTLRKKGFKMYDKTSMARSMLVGVCFVLTILVAITAVFIAWSFFAPTSNV